MKAFYVEVLIPEQTVEVEVLAHSAAEATRIALRDVTPLELSHLSTTEDDGTWMV